MERLKALSLLVPEGGTPFFAAPAFAQDSDGCFGVGTLRLRKSDPVTAPEGCKCGGATVELIHSLRPDRRAEITVKGTR